MDMDRVSVQVRALVFALFLLSGATALIYQVVWSRSFLLVFGASHEAIAIVLAAFMTGLALGSIFVGRRSRAIRRPLRLYGILEAGIGGTALLIPFALRVVDAVYVALAGRIGEAGWSLGLLRAAMAFALLVVPTFFMGATLPLLVRFLVRRYGEFGGRLAGLYGTNTAGAVIGAVAAGFILLPALGVWRTQLLAALINFAVGAIAVVLDRRLGEHAGVDVPDAAAAAVDVPAADVSAAHVPAADLPGTGVPGSRVPWAVRLAFLGTAVSGFSALALEVLWTRSLSVTTGLSVYSFTVMLAAFLLGISVGSWLHAAFPLRRIPETVQFGAAFLAIGLTSLLVSQAIPLLPQIGMSLSVSVFGSGGITAGASFLLSLAVMLVPCIFMGVAFPLAGQARARMKAGFGECVGTVFGLNTLGAVLGSLCAGFILIPSLGLQRSMLLISATYTAYGLLVLGTALAGRLPRRKGLAPAAVCASAAVLVGMVTLPPDWDRRIMGGYSHNCPGLYVSADGTVDVGGALSGLRVLYYREGKGSTVSVYDAGEGRVFQVNGHTEAGDALEDLQHELLLGHIPALLHPDPRSAAVIGLGCGVTAGALAAHGSIERLTVVEIEPAVRGVAEEFSDVNGDLLRDPRLNLVFQDGRNYMLTTSEKFDVITADPLHPWSRGAGYLYTSEYYALLADRLNEGGILCQWLGLYELTADNVRSIVRTFAEHCARTTIWQIAYDIVIIGSPSSTAIDYDGLRRRLGEPAVARQLGMVGLGDPFSFIAEMAMDDAAVRRLVEGAVLHTDDNLYIEFSSPLSTGEADVAIARLIASAGPIPPAMVRNFAPQHGTEEELEKLLGIFRWAKSTTLDASIGVGEGRDIDPILRSLRGVVEKVPEYGRSRVLLGLLLGKLAGMRIAVGQYEEALGLATEAAEVAPAHGHAHHFAGLALSGLGRLEEAEGRFRRAIDLGSLRWWDSYEPLSRALQAMERYGEAVRVLEDGIAARPRDDLLKARLAWLLAVVPDDRVRHGPRAVSLAREAIRLSDRPSPLHHDVLGAAFAECGEFERAIEMVDRAARTAARDGHPEPARLFQGRRAVYAARQALRLIAPSPASQPPASQPPASQPPASQPPASQPPASGPSASERSTDSE